MARYDVHRRRDGLLLNCQSNLPPQLDTRLVVPLVTYSPPVVIAPKLDPTFTFDGRKLVMLTNLAGAVRLRGMGPRPEHGPSTTRRSKRRSTS
jgi:hypothetical protein